MSRALHGLPRVSEATRQRVLAAAAELRYVASPSAASLASGQTNAIGVVAPFVNRWYFAAIVHSAEERLRKTGYDLLLYSLGTDAQERRRAFSGALLRKRVDAVLVLGLQPTADEVAALSAAGGPVAIVGTDVPGWASVRIDDQAAARCAVRHLIDLGHRRIGFIGSSTPTTGCTRAHQATGSSGTAASSPPQACPPTRRWKRSAASQCAAGSRQQNSCCGSRSRRPRSSPPPTRWPWVRCGPPARPGSGCPRTSR